MARENEQPLVLVILGFPLFDVTEEVTEMSEDDILLLKCYKRDREAQGRRELERAIQTFERVNNLIELE